MEKTCINCKENFKIAKDDFEFYEKMKTPPPTHCPDCRRQRRFAIRNERNLHRRTCDKCNKSVISVYSQESEYIVWCNECWYKDDWNITAYGRDYDFERPFFEQFSELEKAAPHFAIFQEGENENCEYINYGVGNKSCYMTFCAFSEDIYYGCGAVNCKTCLDCMNPIGCEISYETTDCTKCYNVHFSMDCTNCSDSMFLIDCLGCSNCFCSSGQRNKKFMFENRQLTEEEYNKRISEIKLTKETIEKWEQRLEEISKGMARKYMHGHGNENVTGDHIYNCKNLTHCFDCMTDLQDSKYCDYAGYQSHHIYDAYAAGLGTEFSYEVNGVTYHNNCKFIYYGRQMQDCEYCKICAQGKKLFGCFGLKHKKFCILNKQYTEEQYNQLIPKIISHMKETGEYGEFFPIEISSLPYNETMAYDYFPMTKEQAIKMSYRWIDKREHEPTTIPSEAIKCEDCNKAFKLISQEIAFYKKFNFPYPSKCHECRRKKKLKLRNPLKLFKRECMKCAIPLETSYPKSDPTIIYCAECYEKEY